MRIVVTGQEIKVSEVGKLVAGSVGQYMCHATVSGADWEGYELLIAFADSRYKKIISHLMTGADETFVIPWEVLDKPGIIRMGCFGVRGALQRPTVWSEEFAVLAGAGHGDTAQEPTIVPWEQMRGWIGDLGELETETKESLVAAINEVLNRFSALDHRDLTHRDADDQHPMSAITGLAEALRQKYEKPSGGIPAGDLSQIVREALAAAIGAVQPEDLAQVATSGEYSDLKNTPAPYDDTAVKNRLNAIEAQEPTWSGKQDAIGDLAAMRRGAALGDTAVQTVNGKSGKNVVLAPADLGIGSVFTLKGSVPTKTQLPSTGNVEGDVYYVVDESVGYIWLNDGQTDRWEMLGLSVDLSIYAKTEQLNAHTGNGDIHVTAQDKTGWSGKYSKPGTGIPKADLAAEVQTSLGKADSALQEVPTAEEVQYDPEEEHTEGSVAEALSSHYTAIANKLDKNLGVAHAQEILYVDDDGFIQTKPGGGGGSHPHWEVLSEGIYQCHVIKPLGYDTTTKLFEASADDLADLETGYKYCYYLVPVEKSQTYTTFPLTVDKNSCHDRLHLTKIDQTHFIITGFWGDFTESDLKNENPDLIDCNNFEFHHVGVPWTINNVNSKRIRYTITNTIFTPYNYYAVQVCFGRNTLGADYAQVGSFRYLKVFESSYVCEIDVVGAYTAQKVFGNFGGYTTAASDTAYNNKYILSNSSGLPKTLSGTDATKFYTSDGSKIKCIDIVNAPIGDYQERYSDNFLQLRNGSYYRIERWVD